MTVTDVGPLLVEDVWISRFADQRRPGELSVLDTTELRWFAPGPIPSDIDGWFSSSTGVCEQRCDTYLLDGRDDVGIKRRSREMLEVKVRQSLDGWMQLGEGLAGQLEAWRKWSPAEGLVDDGSDQRWVDVCKSIVKRRFTIDGTEVAEVTVGAVQGWSFAFAAFGPISTRRDALSASWQGLIAGTPCPELFGLRATQAMGYPEWLARSFVSDRTFA